MSSTPSCLSRPEEVRKLIDRKNALVLVLPQQLRCHSIQQREIVLPFGFVQALRPERTDWAVVVENDGRLIGLVGNPRLQHA